MISIVIPTLNEEKYLPVLLDSIKNQTFKDYEIIISDSKLSKKTKTIVKKYKCKLVKGGNPPEARNNGAKVARGDLLFLDADVVMKDKRFLDIVLKRIEQNNLDLSCPKILPDSNKMSHNMYYIIKNWGNYLVIPFAPHVSGQCLFIKKKLFEKINGYDETLFLAEEHDLAQRAVKAGAKYKFFMDLSVYNSPRRNIKEGSFRLLMKGVYSELYRFFKGKIRKKILNYEFGNY